MNSGLIALALKKQRLQIRSAALRDELAGHAVGLVPIFAAGDKVCDAAHWLRRHPEAMVAAAVALLVARPRAALRWARRGFFAWKTWDQLRGWLNVPPKLR